MQEITTFLQLRSFMSNFNKCLYEVCRKKNEIKIIRQQLNDAIILETDFCTTFMQHYKRLIRNHSTVGWLRYKKKNLDPLLHQISFLRNRRKGRAYDESK